MASHRERGQPKLLDKFLTFRNGGLLSGFQKDGSFRHGRSIASPIVTRTLTAVAPDCDPGHVRQLHIRDMILFRKDGRKRKNGRLISLSLRKKMIGFVPFSLDFVPLGLGIRSTGLGFLQPGLEFVRGGWEG